MLSEDIIKYYGKNHKRKEPRHIFHGLTKCMICKKALVTDRAKKGMALLQKLYRKRKKADKNREVISAFF